jgi:hypothetical protein
MENVAGWTVFWTDVDGQRRCRDLGDRTHAEVFAEALRMAGSTHVLVECIVSLMRSPTAAVHS